MLLYTHLNCMSHRMILYIFLFMLTGVCAQNQQLYHVKSSGSGGSLNWEYIADSIQFTISTSEVVSDTITITPTSTTSKIFILFNLAFVKDANTTARNITVRIRRGTSISDPQVGFATTFRSINNSSMPHHGPVTVMAIDAPSSTSPVNYIYTLQADGGAVIHNIRNMYVQEIPD